MALPGMAIIALGPLTLEETEHVVGPDRATELHRAAGATPYFSWS